jgi:hypothetical protein
VIFSLLVVVVVVVVVVVLVIRLLLQTMVFKGHCNISIWMSIYDAHLYPQHEQFLAMPCPYFCIITYAAFWFNQVGWCFLMIAIAYFCSYWI